MCNTVQILLWDSNTYISKHRKSLLSTYLKTTKNDPSITASTEREHEVEEKALQTNCLGLISNFTCRLSSSQHQTRLMAPGLWFCTITSLVSVWYPQLKQCTAKIKYHQITTLHINLQLGALILKRWITIMEATFEYKIESSNTNTLVYEDFT